MNSGSVRFGYNEPQVMPNAEPEQQEVEMMAMEEFVDETSFTFPAPQM